MPTAPAWLERAAYARVAPLRSALGLRQCRCAVLWASVSAAASVVRVLCFIRCGQRGAQLRRPLPAVALLRGPAGHIHIHLLCCAELQISADVSTIVGNSARSRHDGSLCAVTAGTVVATHMHKLEALVARSFRVYCSK